MDRDNTPAIGDRERRAGDVHRVPAPYRVVDPDCLVNARRTRFHGQVHTSPARGGAPVGVRRAPGRNAALDGLRAVAVTLVLLYHLDVPGFSGGFLGVDLFFVLSGYLITTLLLGESRRHGSIALRGFWARRARRLWPLAWLSLSAVAVAGLLGAWNADQLRQLPAETVAALLHVANWWEAAHGGYVQAFAAPSPLRHFWSLAVEEQFYMVWPVLVAGALALGAGRRRPLAAMWATIGVLAAVSVAAGFVVSPTVAYLGTITRSIALLAGAALALAWRDWPLRGPRGATARRLASAAGVAGALALVAVMAVAHPESPWLAEGGFTVVAAACTGVIAAAMSGPHRLRRALGAEAMVWLGVRSYAVYLVHWPIIVALGPTMATWAKVAIVVPSSLAVAALVHRWVEKPIVLRRVGLRPAALGAAGLAVLTAASLAVTVPHGPTPSERVAASLDAVPDPTIISDGAPGLRRGSDDEVGQGPAAPFDDGAGVPSSGDTAAPQCASIVPAGAGPPSVGTAGGGLGADPVTASNGFDPSTVADLADPAGGGCAVTVLVLGDSTGRGLANGLAEVADPRLQLWDRTELGCSWGGEDCPDWRTRWAAAVEAVDPDVVVVYSGPVPDLHGVDDEDFLSPGGHAQRVTTLAEGVRMLSSGGAKVLLDVPAVPLAPNGLFYCEGRATSSTCDPEWVAEWGATVHEVAAATGAGVVDVAGWVHARGAAPSDRPDGLHLSGSALTAHAGWLVPRIVAAAGRAS
jgi:peptidoglycan/LPS O-acetylase OafA/YrhL